MTIPIIDDKEMGDDGHMDNVFNASAPDAELDWTPSPEIQLIARRLMEYHGGGEKGEWAVRALITSRLDEMETALREHVAELAVQLSLPTK